MIKEVLPIFQAMVIETQVAFKEEFTHLIKSIAPRKMMMAISSL
jgi:hypothetical protein